MTEQTTEAQASAEAAPIVDAVDQIVNDAVEQNKQDEPQKEAEEIDETKEPKEKSYLNALAKKKGQLTKERFLRVELEKRIADLEAKQKAPESKQPDDVPNEKDFEGKPWGEYARAVAKYEAQKLAEENKKTTQEHTSNVERQAYVQERVDHAADNSAAAAKAFPDFKQVENDNMDFVRTLPDPIKEVLREADNPAYAFYQLAKDGQLEELSEASPARAALLIARAEDKALASKKPVTKAPAPLASAKGTGSGGKSLDAMSGEELVKWVNSK